MELNIQKFIGELEEWSQQTYKFLERYKIPPEEIESWINDFDRNSYDLHRQFIAKFNKEPFTYESLISIHFSFLGLSLIRKLIASVPKKLPTDIPPIEFMVLFARKAFEAGTVLATIPTFDAMAKYKSLYNTEGIKAISKKATDEKYSPGRQLYKEAVDIAKSMWEQGSLLKHHQMKRYLIKDYRGETGVKSPFARFDASCGYTEKGLLERLKALAKEMNRPDLISGQKKSS